ncbi:hypothetical protein B566_EDAN006321 [Ephemera danica]|nr:hypothetical protein B566_EDAN006321 [Ephemera danica]
MTMDYKRTDWMNSQAVQLNNDTLSYVGQDCERIPPVLAQVYGARARCLDLSFNCLTSLAGLERFTGLQSLVLDNNMLPDSFHLPRLPYLHTLSLNKNKLSDLDTLLQQVSNHAPHVRHLSLLGNIACPNQLSDESKDEDDYRRYRYYVLYRLPELQFLDSSVVTEYERAEAQRRGRFMRVVKPQQQFSVPTVHTAAVAFVILGSIQKATDLYKTKTSDVERKKVVVKIIAILL